MAEYWYNNGNSQASLGMVGYTGANRYVVVYPFSVGSGGCSNVTVYLSNFYYFHGSNQVLGCKIGTSPSQYAYGTATPDGTGSLNWNGSMYTGQISCSVNLPAGTYYAAIYTYGSSGYWSTVYSDAGYIATSGSYTPSTVNPTFSSVTSTVETQNNVLLKMNNPSNVAICVHFYYGSTKLAESGSFTTQLSYTCPRSWFDDSSSSSPVRTSLTTMSVSMKIYKVNGSLIDSTHSFTLNADSGMKPVLYGLSETTPSFSATKVNTGTIDEFISSLTRIQIDFAKSSDAYVADMSNTAGATIRDVWIEYNGFSILAHETGYPDRFKTGAITGSGYVRVWMEDSRERKGYYDYTFEAYSYTSPRLTSAEVIRCDTTGEAKDDGTRYKVKLSGESTTIGNNANARTITCYSKKTSESSYGTGTVVTESSSTYTILATVLEASSTYMVKIVISDAAGGSQEYLYYLSFEKWMICWTATGEGCGIGQAPDNNHELQIPSTWEFVSGSASFGNSELVLVNGNHYGSSLPSTGTAGQVFFVLTS